MYFEGVIEACIEKHSQWRSDCAGIEQDMLTFQKDPIHFPSLISEPHASGIVNPDKLLASDIPLKKLRIFAST